MIDSCQIEIHALKILYWHASLAIGFFYWCGSIEEHAGCNEDRTPLI